MLRSIALNYMAMNMVPKAKQILLDAIAIEPQNIDVIFHLAQIYYSEQNYQNARQLLEDAYTLLPNTEIANLLAQTYMAIGLYNDAYALYNVVSLALPKNISVKYSLAKCKFEQGELDVAKAHLDDLLKILPEHEEAQELMKKIEEKEIK